MICSSCSREIIDGSRFCKYCGKKQIIEAVNNEFVSAGDLDDNDENKTRFLRKNDAGDRGVNRDVNLKLKQKTSQNPQANANRQVYRPERQPVNDHQVFRPERQPVTPGSRVINGGGAPATADKHSYNDAMQGYSAEPKRVVKKKKSSKAGIVIALIAILALVSAAVIGLIVLNGGTKPEIVLNDYLELTSDEGDEGYSIGFNIDAMYDDFSEDLIPDKSLELGDNPDEIKEYLFEEVIAEALNLDRVSGLLEGDTVSVSWNKRILKKAERDFGCRFNGEDEMLEVAS